MEWLLAAAAAIFAAFISALHYGTKPPAETLPEPPDLPQEASTTPSAPNNVPPSPKPAPVPTIPSTAPESEVLSFATPKQAFHATRVMCDQAFPLTKTMPVHLKDGTFLGNFTQKDVLCAMIFQESRFRKGAIGKPNSNGTIDYGLCQYNNGKLNGKPLWIGPGAAFKDVDEVLNDPQKNVRVMIQTVKAGHWNWWSSFKYNDHARWLSTDSEMWTLKS